jgi:hypothetical protein
MFKKLTPVLVVDAIEPLLPFWTALGFAKKVELPHGDKLGFVILEAGTVELMYQTFDSVKADEAALLDGPRPLAASTLFVEVEDIEAVSRLVPPATDVVVRRRTTFYGSTEMIVRDRAGNAVIFAQMAAESAGS